jgi:Uma2 family endonuclease
LKMAVQEKLYTADDLWALSCSPDNANKQFELIEGVIYEVAASSAISGIIAARIVRFIGSFVDEGGLGYVVTAEGGFELSAKNVLAPDVAFVSKGSVTRLPERYFQVAPDLAVEVVSPTDSIKAVQRKAAKYVAFGTRLVWIVYPGEKTVDVCRPSEQGVMSVQEMSADGVLDGSDVLPGFTLKVSDVFSGLE